MGKVSEVRTAKRRAALDPLTIFAKIEEQPPLMRPEAIKAYLGKEVSCSATFADAREQKPGQVHVVCWCEPKSSKLVVGDVPLADYPQLRQLRVGERLRVRGTIRKIDTLSIELDIGKIIFAQLTHALADSV